MIFPPRTTAPPPAGLSRQARFAIVSATFGLNHARSGTRGDRDSVVLHSRKSCACVREAARILPAASLHFSRRTA